MDKNDEDVVLELGLGSTNYCKRTRLNGSSGAGVNANSGVDMAFAASDPLSELVWSPHNGLSLKCADLSLGDNKSFPLRNVEPGIKDLSTSQGVRSKGSGDSKVVDEEKLTTSPTMIEENSVFAGSNGNMVEEAGTTDAIHKEENIKDNGEEDLCISRNVQIANVAESSKKNTEQDILADGTQESKVDMAINWQFSRKLSEPFVCSLRNLQSRQEPNDEVTSASGDVGKNKSRMPISSLTLPLVKLESSAENDLGCLAAKEADYLVKMRLARENSLPDSKYPANSQICLYLEKGKEKALSDGDIYGRSPNDDDDSHESVESCNSTGLFLKGVKRQSYDQSQLVDSKRMKKQIQGSHDSTSVVRHDSSFMQWISNMVKGLSDSNEKESSSLSLTLARSNDVCGHNEENFMDKKTHDCEGPNMGFQTIFQSLYCRNTKMSNSRAQKDNFSIEESKELNVASKKSLENSNSCKHIIVSDKEVNPHVPRNIVGYPSEPAMFSLDFASTSCSSERSLEEKKASDIPVCNRGNGEVSLSDSLSKQANSTAEEPRLNIPLAMSCMPEKSNPVASLWITRLYTRVAMSENCNRIAEEARECSTEWPKANLDTQINDVFSTDQKTSEARDDSPEDQVHPSAQEIQRLAAHKLSPMQLPQKLKSSEAMASVFAKRLDALRHIICPTEMRKSSSCTLVCFFCGRTGHELRKCPELTEAELEDLLVKISSFERVEECPCLCIRCFQFDHWAISCPLVSSYGDRRLEQIAAVISRPTAGRLQLCAGNHKCLDSCLTWNVKETSNKRISTSNELKKSTASNSENDSEVKQISPTCNFANADSTVVQEEMFHAIRKLRLSRADILRWMDSNVPLSHLNGFFLRLRLGKLEAGLGGTRYYVACITGDMIENIGCKSKKSILVDVGGIKSSVGSQYVSNHDFLEDEIKAWWSRTVKTGGKIPSLDELNSKFQDKKCLGF